VISRELGVGRIIYNWKKQLTQQVTEDDDQYGDCPGDHPATVCDAVVDAWLPFSMTGGMPTSLDVHFDC
jgi:hypothetical protein